MSYPIMPLGTVKLFHDAVYYTTKWSSLVFLSRLVMSDNFHETSFDFMVQVQKDPDRMPIEDAGAEWSEAKSPFIKVATLRLAPQAFRTREREELAEDLSFSPAHSLSEHRPIGGLNRARVEIYRYLSEFRHQQNDKHLIEPRK